MSRPVLQTAEAPAAGQPRPATASFRADIEGLRAVAILVVVAFHSGWPGFSGGYVGVDVFFVISGFLITGLLVREVSTDSRVDMRRFYARRARRLLPASAFVLVAVVALSPLFLSSLRQISVGKDVVSSALYVVNWRFAAQSVDYLSAQAPPSPVQHYWSLAIEEQFYLVWPAIIALVTWLALKRSASPIRWIGFVLATLAAFSFAHGVAQSSAPASAPAAFFATTTRIWELALGGLLALSASRWVRAGTRSRILMSTFGLAAIAYSTTTFDEATRFPGTAALLPTVGAAMFIAAGIGAEATAPGRWLTLRPIVALGGLSYSWYLLHWPPLVMFAARWGEPSLVESTAIAVLSLLAALVMHRRLEQPVHHADSLVAQPWRAAVVALVCASLAVSAGLYLQSRPERAQVAQTLQPVGAAIVLGQSQRSPGPADQWFLPDVLDAPSDVPRVRTDGCQSDEHADPAIDAVCEYGIVDSDRTIVLIGDSHAAHWFSALEGLSTAHDYRLVTLLRSNCKTLDDRGIDGQRINADNCRAWLDNVVAWLAETRPDLVVISNRIRPDLVDSDERLRDFRLGYRRTIQRISELADSVLILADTPDMGRDVPDCVAQFGPGSPRCTRARALAWPTTAVFDAVTALDDVELASMNRFICPTDPCRPVVGNALVYRDQHHMTALFNATLVDLLDKVVRPMLN